MTPIERLIEDRRQQRKQIVDVVVRALGDDKAKKVGSDIRFESILIKIKSALMRENIACTNLLIEELREKYQSIFPHETLPIIQYENMTLYCVIKEKEYEDLMANGVFYFTRPDEYGTIKSIGLDWLMDEFRMRIKDDHAQHLKALESDEINLADWGLFADTQCAVLTLDVPANAQLMLHEHTMLFATDNWPMTLNEAEFDKIMLLCGEIEGDQTFSKDSDCEISKKTWHRFFDPTIQCDEDWGSNVFKPHIYKIEKAWIKNVTIESGTDER